MLKGVPKLISPEFLKVLSEMGHGDRIVLADGNFPCESIGKNSIVIRCDGHGVEEILDAVLTVFPFDQMADKSAWLMLPPEEGSNEPPIWSEYRKVIEKHEDVNKLDVISKPEFIEAAKKAYCIVASSESALYANIMLQKGCV